MLVHDLVGHGGQADATEGEGKGEQIAVRAEEPLRLDVREEGVGRDLAGDLGKAEMVEKGVLREDEVDVT